MPFAVWGPPTLNTALPLKIEVPPSTLAYFKFWELCRLVFLLDDLLVMPSPKALPFCCIIDVDVFCE